MSRRGRGFTLVELMVVVAIIGVLATLGIVSLHRFQRDAKNVEGLATIQAIAAAQERYRAEHLIYLDVSTSLTTYYPMTTPGQMKTTFRQTSGANQANWNRLAVPYSGLVQYGYATKAGYPGASSTLPTVAVAVTWPANLTEPWYIIQARGDLDEDGIPTFIFKSSLNEQIVQENAGE